MNTRAIVMTSADEVGLADVQIPDPGPGEVIVEASYTCISPGTELRCWAGLQPVPLTHPDPHGTSHPFIPGYQMSGTVVARGADTTTPEGTRVLCKGTNRASVPIQWGGHVAHAVLPERELVLLPEELDLLTAAAVKLGAIAYHGMRLSRPEAHERVLVVGLGPIGHMAAALHATSGAYVVGVDLSEARAELVRARGVDGRALKGSLAETLADVNPPGFDVVVDATGQPKVVDDLIAAAREVPWDDTILPGPRYILQGSYFDRVSMPPLAAFEKELSFWWPRDHQRIDIEAVLSLIARGRLDIGAFTSDVRDPQDAQEVYTRLRSAKDALLTSVFKWR